MNNKYKCVHAPHPEVYQGVTIYRIRGVTLGKWNDKTNINYYLTRR